MSEEVDFLLIGGGSYMFGPGSAYASADFDSADYTSGIDSSDAIKEVVNQSLTRHIKEGSLQPPVSTTNWRRNLREILVAQTEAVLDFLTKPSTEQGIVGKVEMILRKYAIRKEVDTSGIKTLSDLLEGVYPGSIVDSDIQENIVSMGGTTLTDLRSQVTSLIDMYKETGERILESENQLKLRIDKIEKLHKQVANILELKENAATEDLLSGMQKYLNTAINDLNIEVLYKELLSLYQKHISLRDAIQLFKTGSCLPSEPVCAICLTDTVSYAIVPCGHTFCTGCCRKMTHDCSICRSRIKDRMRIYIS